MTKLNNEPTLPTNDSGTSKEKCTSSTTPGTPFPVDSKVTGLSARDAQLCKEYVEQAAAGNGDDSDEGDRVAALLGAMVSENVAALEQSVADAEKFVAEKKAQWTCPGCPNTRHNAGRKCLSRTCLTPGVHYLVFANVNGNATMVCFFCKRDMHFLPSGDMPRRRTYNTRG